MNNILYFNSKYLNRNRTFEKKVTRNRVNLMWSWYEAFMKHFDDQCYHHIETCQLICSANQLTGSYMMGTLVVKGLNTVQ